MNTLLDEVWYHIPEFNGYVINNEGNVKSFKNFNAYPNGMYIKSKENKKGERYYELSDLKNRRIRKTVSELLDLVRNSPNLYAMSEGQTYVGSRNLGYTNYNKKHPQDKGSIELKLGMPPIISVNEVKEIKLKFPFEFNKEEEKPIVGTPMISFY